MDCLEGRVVLSQLGLVGRGVAFGQAPGRFSQVMPAQYSQAAPTQFSLAAPAQYRLAAPAQYNQVMSARFGQLTPTRFSQVTPAQLRQVTPTQLDQTAPAQVVQATPTQLDPMTPAQNIQVTPTQLDPMAPAQVIQVTPTQLDQTAPVHYSLVAPAEIGQVASVQVGQATGDVTFSPIGGLGLSPIGGLQDSRGGRFVGGGGVVAQDEQLTQDLEKLRTDTKAVLGGSAVTDAQRLALRTDLEAIAEAGLRIDTETLGPVADRLYTALADGSYDSDTATAQSIHDAFNALFEEATIDQATIDQTFNDIVAIARNLSISTDELATLDTDRAAIQADFERLGIDTTGIQGPKGQSSNLDLILSPSVGRSRGGRI